MDDFVVSKLRRVLRAHHDRTRSWKGLADAIYRANNKDPDRRIDRRTLERICGDEYELVSLKVGQLAALDRYFVDNNEGTLFARSNSLLDVVAESPAVNFFVATKFYSRLNTEAVSRWDLRGITRLLRTRLAPLELKIWDVMDSNDWSELQTNAEHEAKIAIGSPIASSASEALLAEMVGVAPEKRCPQEELPFFIVASENDRKVKSAFVLSRADALKREPSKLKDLAPERRALIVADEYFAQTREEDYALLVAQRHPSERQIHVVLCGLTGPSSYELAKILQQGPPAHGLPELRRGQKHPPILTAVFEITIDWGSGEEKPRRETRKVTASRPISGPTLFYFVEGKWEPFSKDAPPS